MDLGFSQLSNLPLSKSSHRIVTLLVILLFQHCVIQWVVSKEIILSTTKGNTGVGRATVTVHVFFLEETCLSSVRWALPSAIQCSPAKWVGSRVKRIFPNWPLSVYPRKIGLKHKVRKEKTEMLCLWSFNMNYSLQKRNHIAKPLTIFSVALQRRKQTNEFDYASLSMMKLNIRRDCSVFLAGRET